MPFGTMKKVGSVKKSSSSGKGYSKAQPQPSMFKSKKKIVPGVPAPKKKIGPSISGVKPKVVPGVPAPGKKRPLVKPRAKGSAVRGRMRSISRPMAGRSGTKKQRW